MTKLRCLPARTFLSPCGHPDPAGQAVTLSPGGMHIMLLGLTQPLHPGQSFPLTLSFNHAGPRQVTVAIEKAGAMGPGGQPTGSPPVQMHH
jgi:copper(I)-binding protein